MMNWMSVVREAASERVLPPVHPGEVLKEEFLDEYGLSQYELAKRINVPAPRVNDIVRGKRSISADTAWRLGMFFRTSPQFWLNLQAHYDLEVAAIESGDELAAAVPLSVNELPSRARRGS